MRKRVVPVLILALGVAGFAALVATRPESPVVSPTERSWRVEVQTLSPGTHQPVLPLYGQVVAPSQVAVTAALAGRIATRPVADGQAVQAGELLVALDPADVDPVLAQARARVADLEAQVRSETIRFANDQQALKSEQAMRDNARRQRERLESLVKRQLASRESVEASVDAEARAGLAVTTRQRAIDEHPARLASLNARLEEARATLAAAERDAQRARFTAPFDGRVTDVKVAVGDQVSRGTPLLSVYPTAGLELRARVPDVFRAELQAALDQGNTLEARAREGDARFRLDRFAGSSDPSGPEGIFTLMGDAGGLRPGTFVPVTLARPARENTVVIPFSALYGADTVYLMDQDDRMRRVQVQRIGEAVGAGGERQLLVAGDALTPGARLITTHLPNAMTGLKVTVAEAGQ